jgi:hypothetical protein
MDLRYLAPGLLASAGLAVAFVSMPGPMTLWTHLGLMAAALLGTAFVVLALRPRRQPRPMPTPVFSGTRRAPAPRPVELATCANFLGGRPCGALWTLASSPARCPRCGLAPAPSPRLLLDVRVGGRMELCDVPCLMRVGQLARLLGDLYAPAGPLHRLTRPVLSRLSSSSPLRGALRLRAVVGTGECLKLRWTHRRGQP